MNTYQVVKTSDKSVVAEGFASRKAAKIVRDKKNGGPANQEGPNDFIVSRGSDHPCGASFGFVSQSKKWL